MSAEHILAEIAKRRQEMRDRLVTTVGTSPTVR